MSLFYSPAEQKKFDLIGELLSLIENDHESAVLFIEFNFRKKISKTSLIKALQELCLVYPKIVCTAHWKDGHLHWVAPPSVPKACAEMVTEINDQNIYSMNVDLTRHPPLVLHLISSNAIRIGLHHVLTDGYGIMALGHLLVESAIGIEEERPPLKHGDFELRDSSSTRSDDLHWKPSWRFWPWLMRFFWTRKALAKIPPMILGERSTTKKVQRRYIYREISSEDVNLLRIFIKDKFSNISLNDWMISALISTLDEFMLQQEKRGIPNKGGGERISVYVPLSTRPYLQIPELLWNALSGAQVDTFKKDRISRAVLLNCVARQTRNFKDKNYRLMGHWLMLLVHKLQAKFKMDLSRSTPDSWRNACTVCFSNLGRLDFLEDIHSHITAIGCAPATLAPTGFMVGVVPIKGKICFGFSYAEYCLDDTAANALADRFLENLKNPTVAD